LAETPQKSTVKKKISLYFLSKDCVPERKRKKKKREREKGMSKPLMGLCNTKNQCDGIA